VKALRLFRRGVWALKELDSLLSGALARGEVVWVDSEQEADLVVSFPLPREDSDLTTREKEILEYLADGWANEEIANRLGIALGTVKFHLDGLYRKLGVGRRTEAVREGYQRGLLRL